MREKNLKLEWLNTDWKEAYEEMVQRSTGFLRFHTKATTMAVFSKLVLMYPDVNPFLFLEANSPQKRDWWIKDKGDWVKMKYPFPNQLSGAKALQFYKKYLKQGIKTAVPRKCAIRDAVKSSMFTLKKCKVRIDEYEAIWDLYVTEYISPYFIVSNKPMKKWISSRMRKGEISLEEKQVLDNFEKIVYSYSGLNIDLNEILKGE